METEEREFKFQLIMFSVSFLKITEVKESFGNKQAQIISGLSDKDKWMLFYHVSYTFPNSSAFVLEMCIMN